MLQDVDERRNDVGINDSLNLGWRSCGDVGDRPACLFADALFWRGQQRKQCGESS